MDSIKYCKRCGRIFNYKVSLYCPACIIKNDQDFITCRDYIDKNKFVTIRELSENTEVDEKIILTFLKEGRLSLNEGSGLNCENCGASISKGRYCENCFVEMRKDFDYLKSELTGGKDKSNESKLKQNKKSEKMHIAKRISVEKERL